ncbi:MAG: hypothetical protein AAF171_02280 [Cyanobacteria bacterium P01_A01_bin.116]
MGIAGGIKNIEIGDVVAATKVCGYEYGKAGEKGFSVSPTAGQPTYAVVRRAKSQARKGKWLKRLTGSSSPLAESGTERLCRIRGYLSMRLDHNRNDSDTTAELFSRNPKFPIAQPVHNPIGLIIEEK